MPLELALLPVVESAFEPYAYSRARASGLWQFIPGTGSRFGLKQDWWYDGRRDVVESTRAALDYLQSLHDEFDGDWLLAIAAYNCGEITVAARRQPQPRRGQADRLLEPEAPEGNARLRAEAARHEAPRGGSRRTSASASARFRTSPTSRGSRLSARSTCKLAAEIAGITHEELYELNPAFHRWATDPAGPAFLLLPVDGADVFKQNLGQLTPEQRLGATLYTVRPRRLGRLSRASSSTRRSSVIRELNGLPPVP